MSRVLSNQQSIIHILEMRNNHLFISNLIPLECIFFIASLVIPPSPFASIKKRNRAIRSPCQRPLVMLNSFVGLS
ncbi:hypothetical protein Lalb_Chr09g0319661 [Lupinus albus]|uniref:Uncharacterized protein n=1 Tax=Lupinus albus TaxID=3870 RepID=A0A6A4PYL4_LUPAL|nr:hypothetical protein Lalb_Chr09g0319661 [Lupinus albus]